MTVEIDMADPRLARWTAKLNKRLAIFRRRGIVDDKLVKEMQAAVNRAHANARDDGLMLPPLTVFALPTGRHVEVFRADAEPQAIGMTLVYLQKAYNASVADLEWGLKRAYPKFARSQLN